MKRLCMLCVAFSLVLAACGGPTFLGEHNPEHGAPQGGQLDSALACAVDLALSGGDPLMLGSDALPNEVKGGEASQAALHKLPDGGTNSWRGRETLYSLTAGPVFKWRGQAVRSARVRMQAAADAKEWSGIALRDSRNVWHFADVTPRWSHADTLAFYKGIDQPEDGKGNTWNGDAGPCSLILQNSEARGNIIVRNFSLRVGDATVVGVISREAKKAWQLEDVR